MKTISFLQLNRDEIRRKAELVLLVCVVLYAAFFYQVPGFGDIILIPVAVLGAYLFFSSGYSKTVILTFLGSAILIPILSWWSIHQDMPEAASSYPKPAELTSLFLFLPIALAVRGKSNRVLMVLGAYTASLLLMPWISGQGWQDISAGFSGRRLDFSILNAQHAGMLLGGGLITLLVFFDRLVPGRPLMPVRLVFWLIALLFMSVLFMFTQVRAGLVALAVVVPIFILWHLIKASNKTRLLVLTGLASILVLISLTSAFDRVMQRFSTEWQSIQSYPEMAVEDIPTNSIGTRIHLWRLGIDRLWDRPLLGWDRRGGEYLLKNTEGVEKFIGKHFHYHNSYISLWISYGLVGSLFYSIFVIWFGVRTVDLYRYKKIMPTDVFLLSWLFFLYFMVMNLFEQYVFYDSGLYVLAVFLGIIYSYQLQLEDPS